MYKDKAIPFGLTDDNYAPHTVYGISKKMDEEFIRKGDFLRLFGINFPLYSMRYRNMIEDFYAPSNATIKIFGAFNQSYEENVKETIDW